jgi:hypothetical protein
VTHIFCRCGYLPRTWRVDRDTPRVGSVYVRGPASNPPSPFYLTTCQAVGFRWGWDPTVCGADVDRTVIGIPMCKRHARVAECPLSHYDRDVEQRWRERTERYEKMPVILTDGGRKDAGFGHARGDCVYRAIAIANRIPYKHVAESLFRMGADKRMNGVPGFVYEPFLQRLGWIKTRPKGIFLRKGMLPMGRLIVLVSKHMLTVIDGTIYDTYDSSQRGTRRVQAYYTKEVPA